MFAKPYKLKSNNTLKNSEKKHLAQRVQDAFASATEEKVKELVPVKSSTTCMKVVLHSGELIGVYVVDGVPIFLEVGEQLVPTVCALWKFPELIPVLTVHTPVLPKVLGGAALYLPGVTIPTGGVGFPKFPRGAILAACTSDNAASAIIGRAVMSSGDMLLRAVGTCLEPLQVFGDLLCKEAKFSRIERPKLGPPKVESRDPVALLATDISQVSVQLPREEWPSLGPQRSAQEPRLIAEPEPREPPEPPEQREQPGEPDVEESLLTDISELEDEDEERVPEDMDGLLRWTLLCFLKMDGKSTELPLKTNLLYKNHLMQFCPPDRTLEVKKSSYKKMGKFLEAMQREGLVEVRELEKGVDAVTGVALAHPAVRGLRVPSALRAASRASDAEHAPEYAPPVVRELLAATAAVLPLLGTRRKGAALDNAELRAALADYVKARNLNSQQQKGCVVLDAVLAKILGKSEQECVRWEQVWAGVVARMTPSTELRFADGSVRLVRARLPPVSMRVASRAGNKKVTLVSHLEAYGFSVPALARAARASAAFACQVAKEPSGACLLLQGDQTHFVAQLLVDKYGLPKKYLDGADKALNKKK